MGTQTHTPGPWKVHKNKQWGSEKMYSQVVSEAADMVIVNGCAPGGRQEEADANAALMAAAPDLLAACKAAEVHVARNESAMLAARKIRGTPEQRDERDDVLDALRAAIAKAEGK